MFINKYRALKHTLHLFPHRTKDQMEQKWFQYAYSCSLIELQRDLLKAFSHSLFPKTELFIAPIQ